MGRNAHYNIASDFADNASPLFTGVCVGHLKGNPMTESDSSIYWLSPEYSEELRDYASKLYVSDIETFCHAVVTELDKGFFEAAASSPARHQYLKDTAWTLCIRELKILYSSNLEEIIDEFNLQLWINEVFIRNIWESIARYNPIEWFENVRPLTEKIERLKERARAKEERDAKQEQKN